MMKKLYEKPEIQVLEFETEDVITTSGEEPIVVDRDGYQD